MADSRDRGAWREHPGTEWLGEDAPKPKRPMERPEVLELVKKERKRAKARRYAANKRARRLSLAEQEKGLHEVVVHFNGTTRASADSVAQAVDFVDRPRAPKGLWAVTFVTKAGERLTLLRDTRSPAWKHWVVESEAKA